MAFVKPAGAAESGFTLLEIMIVASILAILASIGVPQYVSALRIARVTKAKQELRTLAQAIDSYTANHEGNLPLTLYQVGYGGKRDPWGLPYCYLNYADGTGDGLDWALAAGLVDPSAVKGQSEAAGASSSSSSGGAAAASPGPSRGAVFAWSRGSRLAQDPMTAAAMAEVRSEGAAASKGVSTATAVTTAVSREIRGAELASLVQSLAAAPGARVFAGVAVEPTRRRDRYLFPLNTDYDLFSLGPDAQTTVSLGDALGQDDVIRANNGGYFGPAAEY